MKIKSGTFCLLLLLVSGLQGYAQKPKADLLLYNVTIINVVDGSIRKGAAIAVAGGNIISIGKYQSLKKKFEASEIMDGKQKYVIPGLWDMHVHLEGADLIPDNQALLPLFLA